VPEDEVLGLIDHSYELVVAHLTKTQRDNLNSSLAHGLIGHDEHPGSATNKPDCLRPVSHLAAVRGTSNDEWHGRVGLPPGGGRESG
jgi:hypothetical protein